jgi:hypothetical protein
VSVKSRDASRHLGRDLESVISPTLYKDRFSERILCVPNLLLSVSQEPKRQKEKEVVEVLTFVDKDRTRRTLQHYSPNAPSQHCFRFEYVYCTHPFNRLRCSLGTAGQL